MTTTIDADLPKLIVEYPLNARENPLDLGYILYKGGAESLRFAASKIQAGDLGSPLKERLPFAVACFDHLDGARMEGLTKTTVKNRFNALRTFVAFVDASDTGPLGRKEVISLFGAWANALDDQIRRGAIKEVTAYGQVNQAAKILCDVYSVSRQVLLTEHRGRKRRINKKNKSGEKELTGAAHGFISDLKSIIRCLSLERIAGEVPITITLESSGYMYDHWARERPSTLSGVKARTPSSDAPLRTDQLLQRRAGLLNLRVSAEYHLFIANTGLNASQASGLVLDDFRFESFKGGYNVKKYKERKGGEVVFWITKRYRPFFEAYLAFRREVYADVDSSRLFVILAQAGQGLPAPLVNTQSIRYFMRDAGRPYVSPSKLRIAKANVVQRITGDTTATALVMQHSPAVLERSYLRGNMQDAISQMSRFFETVDPERMVTTSPAEGDCKGHHQPARADYASDQTPKPDCVNPKGCLFCVHHRGISAPHYPWAQASYREYLRLELGTHKRLDGADAHPVVMTIERISDELIDFATQSEEHRAWVESAERRVADDDFHPHWRFHIDLLRERL